jgi:hypothetical protein
MTDGDLAQRVRQSAIFSAFVVASLNDVLDSKQAALPYLKSLRDELHRQSSE